MSRFIAPDPRMGPVGASGYYARDTAREAAEDAATRLADGPAFVTCQACWRLVPLDEAAEGMFCGALCAGAYWGSVAA